MSHGPLFQAEPEAVAHDDNALRQVLFALGQLQTGVERLREDFTDERRSASESRAAVHRRLDEQARDISEMKTTLATTKIAMDAVGKDHSDVIKPAVAEWKQMKSIGTGVVALLALGGLSIGAALMWAGETAVTTLRHWLRIT